MALLMLKHDDQKDTWYIAEQHVLLMWTTASAWLILWNLLKHVHPFERSATTFSAGQQVLPSISNRIPQHSHWMNSQACVLMSSLACCTPVKIGVWMINGSGRESLSHQED